MKKILVILASLILALSAFAEKKSGNIDLGIYSSYNIPTTTYTFYPFNAGDKFDNEAGNGFSIGFGLKFFFIDNNAIVFGAGYDTLTAKYKLTINSFNGTEEAKYDFINLQLGYRFYLQGFFAGAGLNYGLITKAKLEMGGAYGDAIYSAYGTRSWEVGDKTLDPNGKKYNNMDIYFELGYNIPLNDKLNIDILGKYRLGLTHVYKDGTVTSSSGGSTDFKLKIFLIQIGFNYSL